MKISVLSHAPPGTGTFTSSHRIAGHLSSCGHETTIVEHWDPDVESVWERHDLRTADLLVGTHAIQSGKVFLGAQVPYILVLSGTDLNETTDSSVADAAVAGALRVVAYDRQHYDKAFGRWATHGRKLRHIPKGVTTSPSLYNFRATLGIGASEDLFLLPSGLRPVKDVLYLADIFDEWGLGGRKCFLAIVGIPRDPEYVEEVHRRCTPSRNILVVPPLRQHDLHAAMQAADVVLNTSHSESSANAVLEAMHLGACVFARNIPGNQALIAHGETGLLFDDPDGFRSLVDDLHDGDRPSRLGVAAATYARTHHSLEQERARYCDLLSEFS